MENDNHMKLHFYLCDVASLSNQVKLEDAEQKKTVAEGIAENVSREKAIVEVETAKAQVQAEQVAKTQAEVSKNVNTHSLCLLWILVNYLLEV